MLDEISILWEYKHMGAIFNFTSFSSIFGLSVDFQSICSGNREIIRKPNEENTSGKVII